LEQDDLNQTLARFDWTATTCTKSSSHSFRSHHSFPIDRLHSPSSLLRPYLQHSKRLVASAMPRQSKSASTTGIKDNTLVVDNGGYTIKAGFVTATPDLHDCKVIPNCIARDNERKVWVGSQLEQCKDFRDMAFRRPVDKGYLVNWEGEKAIWGHSFFSENSLLQVGRGCVYGSMMI
jgi:hypothetical protein